MNCRILLTGFQHSSAERLLSAAHEYDTLLLPNDKRRDGELLTDLLLQAHYDLIVCIGQRPNIKDKIHIESTARENDITIQTNVDCHMLVGLFASCGVSAKQSNNAGTSFCNAVYFNGLKFVNEHRLHTGVVFIHIPFLKNMSCPDSFVKCFFRAIDSLRVEGVEDLWIK